jgi:threonine dehydrogenase-like Zn-dependent dehydrogenase
MVAGRYGEAEPGRDRLVIGHEMVGRVVAAPDNSGLRVDDLVAGLVRRSDALPCASCVDGCWDQCESSRPVDAGISYQDGFAAELCRADAQYWVPVESQLGLCAALTEPTAVVAKAWERALRAREDSGPCRVAVTGGGVVGLLAALVGASHGFDVRVVDKATDGRLPALVEALGVGYRTGDLSNAVHDVDVVLECTGAPEVVAGVLSGGRNQVVCLAGLTSGSRTLGGTGLHNMVVLGSVSAGRRHYIEAARILYQADRDWLGRLVRPVSLESWSLALQPSVDGRKPVIDFELGRLPMPYGDQPARPANHEPL